MKDLKSRLIGKYAILGDAAGMVLLKRNSGKIEYVNSVMQTNGVFFDKTDNVDDHFLIHYKQLVKLLKSVIEESGISFHQISKILVPNANLEFYRKILDRFKLDNELIYDRNNSTYGHLTSLDLVVNLRDYLEEINEPQETYILAFGFSVAGNYQAVIFRT